jgi:hypothetical protein
MDLRPAGQIPEQVSLPASSTKLELHENQFYRLENIYAVDEFEDLDSTRVRLHRVTNCLIRVAELDYI